LVREFFNIPLLWKSVKASIHTDGFENLGVLLQASSFKSALGDFTSVGIPVW